jgi:hypothetical protein
MQQKMDLKRKTVEDTTAASVLLSLDCKSHQIHKRHRHSTSSPAMEARDLPPIIRYHSQEERDCFEISRSASTSVGADYSSDSTCLRRAPIGGSIQLKSDAVSQDAMAINRAKSHELESAMALASLAHQNIPTTTMSASVVHRRNTCPTNKNIVFTLPNENHGQRFQHFSNRLVESPYMHPHETSRYYATFPLRGHIPHPQLHTISKPRHQPHHQHQYREQHHQWACDFCGQGSFLSYGDACRHETLCPRNPQVIVKTSSASKSNNHYLSARSHSMTSVSSSSSSKSVLGSSDTTSTESSPVDQDESKFYSGVIALAVPSADPEWLSELNCYIRKNCIQAFSAEQGKFSAGV